MKEDIYNKTVKCFHAKMYVRCYSVLLCAYITSDIETVQSVFGYNEQVFVLRYRAYVNIPETDIWGNM